MAKIVIVEGPDAGKEFTVEQAAILGRLDTNDIPIRDGKASREHAKIYRQGVKYALVDLNSSNGTHVNGNKVSKVSLDSGDEIQIGVVVLRFVDEEADAIKAAAPQRRSLDDAFDAGQGAPAQPQPAAAGAGQIEMRGHKPLQPNRVKAGRTVGLDLNQMSDGARFLTYLVLAVVFGVVIWLAYKAV